MKIVSLSRWAVVALAIAWLPQGVPAQAIPAFPGAEGAGAIATGGRPKVITGNVHGRVYHVTNLEPDPTGTIPGSLRYGMRDENFPVPISPLGIYDINDLRSWDAEPRIIVFDVGGTIPIGEVDMTPRNFTIAGQTAPGGITLYGGELNPGHRDQWVSDNAPTQVNNLIIRNLAVRTNDANEKDALWLAATNSIADHISGAWYTDEALSITDSARNVTAQYSIWGPGWNNPDGDGSQIEGSTPMADISVHHNLYIHNDARIPRVGEKHGPGVELDFRNNVIYNWDDNHAGYSTTSQVGGHEPSFSNFVNNYYIGGADNDGNDEIFDTGNNATRIYQSGNLLDLNMNGTADGVDLGWAPFDGNEIQQTAPYAVPHGVTQTADEALSSVQNYAGARWWDRDFLDQRLIDQLQTFGNGTDDETGEVINTVDPNDVDALVNAPMQIRPVNWDADNDGMPGWWEEAHGLDPNSPAESSDWDTDLDGDGYINVEEYINEIAEWPAPYPMVFTGGTNSRYAQITNWSITRPSPDEADTTTFWQPARFDTAVIRSGTVVADAVGQHAGHVMIGTESGDDGELSITDGWLRVEGQVSIGVDPGATAAVTLSGGTLSTGALAMGDGGSFSMTDGVLHADVVAFDLENNGGTLAPGHSIAAFNPDGYATGENIGLTRVMGDLTLSDGTLEIEVAGTGAGEFDRVEVDGIARLGGTLQIVLAGLGGNVYEPQLGDQFAILMADGGVDEVFDDFDWPDLSPGLTWAIGPSEFTVLLQVVAAAALAGDYNGNGVVDAADYTVWRDQLGQTGPDLAADGTGPEGVPDGMVDALDYQFWVDNFGNTLGSGGTSLSPVPEPAALLMAISAVFLFPRRRRGAALRHSIAN